MFKHKLLIKTTKASPPCRIGLVLVIDSQSNIKHDVNIQALTPQKKIIYDSNKTLNNQTHYEYIIDEFSCSGGGCGSSIYENRKYLETIEVKIKYIV